MKFAIKVNQYLQDNGWWHVESTAWYIGANDIGVRVSWPMSKTGTVHITLYDKNGNRSSRYKKFTESEWPQLVRFLDMLTDVNCGVSD